jgi:hypothetical protein
MMQAALDVLWTATSPCLTRHRPCVLPAKAGKRKRVLAEHRHPRIHMKKINPPPERPADPSLPVDIPRTGWPPLPTTPLLRRRRTDAKPWHAEGPDDPWKRTP